MGGGAHPWANGAVKASPDSAAVPPAADWLIGGGEMARLIKAMGWSRTM